jgi:DNA-binding MarR family transcriptional regulator
MSQGTASRSTRVDAFDDRDRLELERSSWHAVVRTYMECSRRYGRMLREFGLTEAQYDVMHTIRRLGDRAMPHAIAERLLVSRANVTGVLKRLVREEYVSTHKHSEDRRASICSLTQEGSECLDRAQQAAALFIHEQASNIQNSELELTRAIMRRVEARLIAMDPIAIAEQARGRR